MSTMPTMEVRREEGVKEKSRKKEEMGVGWADPEIAAEMVDPKDWHERRSVVVWEAESVTGVLTAETEV